MLPGISSFAEMPSTGPPHYPAMLPARWPIGKARPLSIRLVIASKARPAPLFSNVSACVPGSKSGSIQSPALIWSVAIRFESGMDHQTIDGAFRISRAVFHVTKPSVLETGNSQSGALARSARHVSLVEIDNLMNGLILADNQLAKLFL